MTKGGHRPGSGRKVIDPEKKRVQMMITISQVTRSRIALLKAKGINIGRLIDDLVREYCEMND